MAWRSFQNRSESDLQNVDVIVIGSGIAGLTSAALLGKHGRKVLVLEQHEEKPGGCLHDFSSSDGFSFCSGLHYVSVKEGSMARPIFDDITNNMPVSHDGEHVYDSYYDSRKPEGERWIIQVSPKNFDQVVGVTAAKFQRLVDLSGILFAVKLLWAPLAWIVWGIFVLMGWRNELTMPYAQWFKKNHSPPIPDSEPCPDKAWLARGDHGVPRDSCPAVMQAIIWAHYCKGVSTFNIPDMVRRICLRIKERGGGSVLIGARVQSLIRENGRCVGVVIDGVEIRAREAVVCAAGAWNAVQLAPELSDLKQVVEACGPSPGHGCVFLTFPGKKAREDLDLPSGNVWADDHCKDGWFLSYKEDAKGTHLFIIWEADYISRDKDYVDKKDAVSQKFYDKACAVFPKLKTANTFDASTPATSQHYLNSWKGGSYGLAVDTRRFGDYDFVRTLRPETQLPGFVLCGQDVFMIGVFGAMISSMLTVQHLVAPGFWNFLRNNVMLNMYNDARKKYLEAKKQQQGMEKEQ